MTPSPSGDARQEALFEALSRPGALAAAAPERIDTHLSTILLTEDRAYKAMRAIRYDFVDFTTLEARRDACRSEIAANHAAARLYLRAVPVVETADGPRLGDPGDPAPAVEWLVEMRRFDRRLEFDQLLERGALDRPTVEALADVAAEMHDAAPRRPATPFRDALDIAIDESGGVLGAAPDPALGARATAWRTQAAAEAARLGGLLDARMRDGRVRRCHGDLHLGNICLFEGRPTPFDAIAFSDRLSDIDMLYDAAFTVMDLIRRGAPDLANAFLSRYLSATRDYAGLALFPLFVSLRAAIRGMIAAFSDDWAEASAYLALAERSLAPRRARLIAVGGASGSGKSTLARRLAVDVAQNDGPVWGAVVLRSDVARKRLLGLSPEAPAPRDSYTQAMSDRVYEGMAGDAAEALRAGLPALMDAAFLKSSERRAAADLAQSEQAPFLGVWLEADLETRLARVGERRGDASDADAAVAAAQSPEPLAEAGWVALDAAGDPDSVAAAGAALLRGSEAGRARR